MKFILTADWHVRGERPRCRLDDDWIESQRNDINFVIDLANRLKLPIYNTGDIFDSARVSTSALNMVIECLKRLENDFFILPGNHDLLMHNYQNMRHSSIGVLTQYFGELKDGLGVTAQPFGLDEQSDAEIRFMHRLVFPDEKSRPMEGCGQIAQEILDEFPNQKFIFTGDYHHHFIYENDGRYVVNPGCLNIQKADYIDYKPIVFIVDTDKASFEPVEIPVDASLATRDYLVDDGWDERTDNLVVQIKTNTEVTLDFEVNLEEAMNKIAAEIKNCILEIQTEVRSNVK